MRLSEIPGQPAAIERLARLLMSEHLPHALLLHGPEGVGKLPLAHALLQRLLCLQPVGTDACGQCAGCRKSDGFAHPDLTVLLPIFGRSHEGNKALSAEDFLPAFREKFAENAYLSLRNWAQVTDAENKQLMIPVHEVRGLQRKLQLRSYEGGNKVVLIWHAEKMNAEAANSLLKLLEEPPPQTYFLLTTPHASDLLPTVLSRCQRLALARWQTGELERWLTETAGASPAQAHEAALLADGSAGGALELLHHTEQSLGQELMDWLRNLARANVAEWLQEWAKVKSKESREVQKVFIESALQKIRAAVLFRAGVAQLALAPATETQFLERFSAFLQLEQLEAMAELLETALAHLARNASGFITFYNLGLDIHRILARKA